MDPFSTRMKLYEGKEAQRRFIPLLPIVVRLDGKTFSKFTRGLKRPYDERLSQLMIDTMRYLAQETNARVITETSGVKVLAVIPYDKGSCVEKGLISNEVLIAASMVRWEEEI